MLNGQTVLPRRARFGVAPICTSFDGNDCMGSAGGGFSYWNPFDWSSNGSNGGGGSNSPIVINPPVVVNNPASTNTATACRCATRTIFDADGNCSCAPVDDQIVSAIVPVADSGDIFSMLQAHPFLAIFGAVGIGYLAFSGKK